MIRLVPDFELIKSCATTHFVNCGDVRVGTINYPGTGEQEDKSLKHHALLKDKNEPSGSKDLGHFADEYQAYDAIKDAFTCQVTAENIIHRIAQKANE